MLTEFRNFMSEDRGLSPKTVEHRCAVMRPFLHQLLDGKRCLATITICDVDSLLLKKVNEEQYARVSVRAYASSLRSFFRYAEMRGWRPAGRFKLIQGCPPGHRSYYYGSLSFCRKSC